MVRVGTALMLVAGVAACSGGDEKVELKVKVPGAAPQGSVAAPPGAGEPTAEGAVAFIGYYTGVYSAAYESGDTTVLKTLSVPTCAFCVNSIKDIEAATAAGTKNQGSAVHVVGTTPKKLAKGRARILVDLKQDAGTVTPSGGQAETNPGFSSMKAAYHLVWTKDRWVIGDIRNDITSMVPNPG